MMAGLFISASVIWIAVILLLRERIALAIGLVRESSKALLRMPILTILPLLYVGIFGLITIIFSIYCAYLASSGDITTHYNSTTGMSYKEISFTEAARNTIAFVIFVYLWTIGFLEAMGHILSSHAILTWYFSDDKSLIGSSQACKSAYISFRFHAGSAAVGSFLIAFLRGIRIILEYVQHKLEVLSNRNPVNGCCRCTCGVGTFARFFLCSLSCCLCCFEGFVRFINKHAYIQTGTYHNHHYYQPIITTNLSLLISIITIIIINISSLPIYHNHHHYQSIITLPLRQHFTVLDSFYQLKGLSF